MRNDYITGKKKIEMRKVEIERIKNNNYGKCTKEVQQAHIWATKKKIRTKVLFDYKHKV